MSVCVGRGVPAAPPPRRAALGSLRGPEGGPGAKADGHGRRPGLVLARRGPALRVVPVRPGLGGPNGRAAAAEPGGGGERRSGRGGGGSGVGDCGAPGGGGGAESARRARRGAGGARRRAARRAVAQARACGAGAGAGAVPGVGGLPPGPVFGGRWGWRREAAVYRCHNYAGPGAADGGVVIIAMTSWSAVGAVMRGKATAKR